VGVTDWEKRRRRGARGKSQRGQGRRSWSKTEKANVMRALLGFMAEGEGVSSACRMVGVSKSFFYQTAMKDPWFAGEVGRIKSGGHVADGVSPDQWEPEPKDEVPDFPEFCEQFLGQRLFPHQLQWFDLLEGREPRDVHPACEFVPGKKSRIIVNTPPGHAKSTTITVNYVLWRILKNPSVKVVIVSKAQKLADQFLLQIKERLTSDQYQTLIDAFAPPGGFDGESVGWSANRFYISSKVRGAEAKDPTVQAVGIRGQLYGSRADLIVVDDAVDNTNVADYDKQISWLLGIVGSRLAPRSGRLLVVGTRIAPTDLYIELQDGGRYYSGDSPWTYFKQPAVLEYAEHPEDWLTLWPRSDSAADPDEEPDLDGMFRRWDGETLAEVRDGLPSAEWSRIYQQEQVSEDSYFTPEMIADATRGSPPGRLPDSNAGRPGGMAGLRVVAGLDPAMSGYTAAVVVGYDKYTSERWVLDVHNQPSMKPDEIRDLIKRWTDKYAVHEWRIEKNAFQAFLTQDTDIRNYLAARGTILTDHLTGNNKNDPQFGVAALTMLFDTGLISLPRPSSEGIRALREQLLTWDPKQAQSKHALKGHKTDTVMALWFAEVRCQEYTTLEFESRHSTSIFHTRRDKARQYTMPASDLDDRIGWG